MEFPDLGKNCNEPTCNRLDFLPVKCDSCNKIFCSTHFSYERHSCPTAHRKDVQVPICPLCGQPVPTAPGTSPDLTVGQHIDQQCKSDTKKIFNNRCHVKNCKRKELIPVLCYQCNQNFCLRHRHTADHDCKGSMNARPSGSNTGSGSLQNIFRNSNGQTTSKTMPERSKNSTSIFKMISNHAANSRPTAAAASTSTYTTANHIRNVQGNMSEDEALSRAIALSILELDETVQQNPRNESTEMGVPVPVGGRDQQTSAKDKCSLS